MNVLGSKRRFKILTDSELINLEKIKIIFHSFLIKSY